MNEVNSFAGKAITVGGGTSVLYNRDTYVGYCFIAGFEYAIYAHWTARLNVEFIKGDCTNGFHFITSGDWNQIAHIEFWPYVVAHISPGEYTVTGAANNGSGLIRLTTATHVIETGDTVVVHDVLGTLEANGRWIATKIDATHVDLQGSTFTNTFTASPSAQVILNTFNRHGSAFYMENVDWVELVCCQSYGYNIGFDINGTERGTLLSCNVDNSSWVQDPTTIGIRIRGGSSQNSLITCKTAGLGTAVYIDPNNGENVLINGLIAWGIIANDIYVNSGYVTIVNSSFSLGISGTLAKMGLYVNPTADGVYVAGNRMSNGGTYPMNVTGDALRKSIFGLNAWADGSSIGWRESRTSSQATHYSAQYQTNTTGTIWRYQKARGSVSAPLASISGDNALVINGDYWDGVDTFRTGASWRMGALETASPTSVAARHVWGVAATGEAAAVERLMFDREALCPVTHRDISLGKSNLYFQSIYTGYVTFRESMPTPTAIANGAQMWVDSGGAIKIMLGNGTIKTFTVT
jgi:hypothetical protein